MVSKQIQLHNTKPPACFFHLYLLLLGILHRRNTFFYYLRLLGINLLNGSLYLAHCTMLWDKEKPLISLRNSGSALRCLTTSQLISNCSFLQKQHLLLQAAANHPHKPISAATKSIRRASGQDNAGLQHARSHPVSKTDELSVDRSRKDRNCTSSADRAFALEELGISRMLAPPLSPGRVIAVSNSTDRAERNGESLRISAGLGRKRLKIMKYSGKGKGVAKVAGASFSPDWVEGKMCRKPELILEMLKRKR